MSNMRPTEQKLNIDEKKLKFLFNNSTSGIAYHKIIYDTNGKPIDYIITDVNPKYESIIPLEKEDVLNKKATEVYQAEKAPYLDIFSHVADTGESTSFETYYEPMDKSFNISVISPRRGEFFTVFDDISERILVERRIKESEEKHRGFINNILDIIIECNLEGEFLTVSHQCLGILGFKPEEMIGKRNMDFVHPDDVPKLISTMKKNTSIGAQAHIEHRCIHKEGHYVTVFVKGQVVEIDGKKKFIGLMRDITKQKEIERNLRESEEKFRTLFESSKDGIALLDMKGNYVDCNNAMTEMLGYTKNELIGMNRNEVEFEKWYEKTNIMFSEVLAKGYSDEFEIEFKKKNNHIIPASLKAWVRKDINGKNLGIWGIIRDISERKNAEQKLKESEEKFRTITEQSLVGILILQDDVFKYANQRVANIIGYTIEEIQSWGPREFAKVIHPDYQKVALEQARKKQNGSEDIITDYIIKCIKKTGEYVWVELFSRTISYQGRFADFITFIDINDKKQAEDIIIEENKRLLELQELRKDLITRVSHELKTPTTSIYGTFQVLKDLLKDELSEKALKYVDIGYRGSLRLKQLINNLLDASRLDSKKLELKLQKENISEIINDSVNDMTYLTNDRGLKIDMEIPNEVNLDVDKLRMRQVITNLISNAIKNTPFGGNIYINLIEEDDYMDINIRDTGVGLTKKEKEKLFEKFGKIERYASGLGVDIEGSGLGLYISKEIVELHGGQILVESEGRNKGATFTIRVLKT